MPIWSPPEYGEEWAGESAERAFRNRVFSAVEKELDWVTVPLTVFQDGVAADPRTGVLIQIDQMRFLVTAAHNLRECCEAGLLPHLVMPEKGLDPIPLSSETFWSTKDPKEDLCVTQLEEITTRAIGEHYRFVRLDRMMNQYDERHGSGFYVLYGFPRDLTVKDSDGVKRRDSWRYLTTLYDGEVSSVEDYDPNLHMLLLYEKKSQTNKGHQVLPYGLSGCGIWYVGNHVTHALFTPEDFELAGIQTAWHRKFQYAKGTWINQVLRVLWKHYPDTRGPMAVYGMTF